MADEIVELWESLGRSKRAVSEALGVSRSTVRRRLEKAFQEQPPPFAVPDGDLSADEILEHMAKRFEARLARQEALTWFEIPIKDKGPIAINWFGDPHLGSNGCNVPLLRRDVKLVAGTPGMYGANIGDTADNWGSKLVHLYAQNDVSRETERRLAKWFLCQSKVPWLLWLMGNHDLMDDAFHLHLKSLGGHVVPMLDWRAKFKLVFPNGREVRIDAAHDHKGHSQWNELHGQERAAVFDEPADLYVAGHRHDWAHKTKELPGGRVCTLVRCRGYKWLDDHAHRLGFGSQHYGASMVTIINPEAPGCELIKVYADVEEGAKALERMR